MFQWLHGMLKFDPDIKFVSGCHDVELSLLYSWGGKIWSDNKFVLGYHDVKMSLSCSLNGKIWSNIKLFWIAMTSFILDHVFETMETLVSVDNVIFRSERKGRKTIWTAVLRNFYTLSFLLRSYFQDLCQLNAEKSFQGGHILVPK